MLRGIYLLTFVAEVAKILWKMAWSSQRTDSIIANLMNDANIIYESQDWS